MSPNTNKKDKTEVRFLGSLTLLVGALLAFVFLLFYFTPEEQNLVSEPKIESKPALAQQQKPRPLRQQRQYTSIDNGISPQIENQPQMETAPATAGSKGDPLIEKAITLIDNGDPEEALVILEKILKDDPTNERALIEVSMVHLIDYRNSQAAVPYLERAFKVNPSNRMVLAELVSTYSEQNTVDTGIEFLQSLQDKASPESSAYISLGMGQMLMAEGREDEAIPYLERAVESVPQSPDILSNLGDTWSLAGNSERAIETYRKAIDARKIEINQLIKEGKPVEQKKQVLIQNHIEIVREYFNRGEFDAALEELDIADGYAPNNNLLANWRKRVAKRRG